MNIPIKMSALFVLKHWGQFPGKELPEQCRKKKVPQETSC